MADTITVAAVQPAWQRLATADDVRREVGRYLRLARNKGAGLVIFPEHFGLMLALPLTNDAESGVRGSLLKQSLGRSGFWGRLMGAVTGGAAEMLGGLPALLPKLLEQHSDLLRDMYVDLFGAAAREHGVYLVAGSIYLRDTDGMIRAMSGVFDRTGTVLGWQAKLHVGAQQTQLIEPGQELMAFETDFGRFGVLLGGDVLYPELARALAYRGVTAIACPAAATTAAEWQQLRITLNARAQENQIFLAQSFLTGENELRLQDGSMYQGRSAIVAPASLSPHYDGVLMEVGSPTAEAVISSEWDFHALRDEWETGPIRPRTELRGALFENLLRFDYESGATIDERVRSLEETASQPALPEPETEEAPAEEMGTDDETAQDVEPAVDEEPAEADAASDEPGQEDAIVEAERDGAEQAPTDEESTPVEER